MPYTPYHFGPSGFIALTLRRWIDIPVFILANVIVDVEVLAIGMLDLGRPKHRYAHTLLLGAAIGVVWGLAAYLFRRFIRKIMQVLCIPYETGFWKMVISGVFGVWLHVVIDAIYHWDIYLFWPSTARPLFRLLSKDHIQTICAAFFIPVVILYILTVISFFKKHRIANKSI